MMPAGVQFYAGPPLAPRNVPADAFTGGLALNTHGELRFYGPTSSYRAVLADHSSINPSQIDAARTFSLTRAPIPGATPADPALPRKPPVLSEAFRDKLIKLAWAYCLSGFGLGQEAEFCHDLRNTPYALSHFTFPVRPSVAEVTRERSVGIERPITPPSSSTWSSPSDVVISIRMETGLLRFAVI